MKHYEKGLNLYFQKKWKQAITSFEKTLSIKDDHASSVLITRCKEFLKHPPAKNWDGVWEMKTK